MPRNLRIWSTHIKGNRIVISKLCQRRESRRNLNKSRVVECQSKNLNFLITTSQHQKLNSNLWSQKSFLAKNLRRPDNLKNFKKCPCPLIETVRGTTRTPNNSMKRTKVAPRLYQCETRVPITGWISRKNLTNLLQVWKLFIWRNSGIEIVSNHSTSSIGPMLSCQTTKTRYDLRALMR